MTRQWRLESAAQGKLVDASEVHSWLNSWGTENEQDAPRSGRLKCLVSIRPTIRWGMAAMVRSAVDYH